MKADPVLTWWQGRVRELGFGQGEDVVVNSNYQKLLTVRASNGLQADLHDFQIEPDNVAYITAYNVIRCDLSSHGGVRNGAVIVPAVQEIDMKTGLVRWEWSSLDHIPVSSSHTPAPTIAAPWDYFHLNSIDVLPEGGLLISARATWALYKLAPGRARSSGASAATTPASRKATAHRPHGSTMHACCPTAKSRCSTTAPTRVCTTSRAVSGCGSPTAG